MIYRDKTNVPPTALSEGDMVAIKVVAVAGAVGDWAAYFGPSDWTDEQVAENGDKLAEFQARPLFYCFCLRSYRS